MLSFVFVPINFSVDLMSIFGNFDVIFAKISAEISIPGKIAPPMNSFLLFTISIVPAVPISITIEGYPYKYIADIAFTSLSAPISFGFL